MTSDGWPALGWEEVEWRPAVAPELMPRSIRQRHSGPYQAAVVPEIAELPVRLPGPVLAKADEATAEIARFDAELVPRV